MQRNEQRSKRRLRIIFARGLAGGALAVAAALGGSALTATQGCTDDPPKAKAPEPTTIGVSLGLTNGLAAFAGPLRDAVRVAEGELNAAGGLLGRPVVFHIVDDHSSEDPFVDGVAQGFVDEGAVAVIGPIGSQQVVRTQAIYAGAKMVQITPSATSTDLTSIQPIEDRWLFRTTPADDFQGAAVLLFAKRTPRGLTTDGGVAPQVDGGPPSTCTDLAIVNIDNAYGNSMADVIEKNFPKQASKPILIRKKVSVDLAASYADIASEIIALQPQCLALIAYDDVAAQFVRDFKADPGYAALEQGGFFFIGTDGVYTEGFIKRGRKNAADPTSDNIAEGVYGTNPDTQPGTKEYNEFRTLYSSYFPLAGEDAPPFTANTFDAAVLLALAIQKAGSVDDREGIRAALLEIASPPGKPYTPGQIGEALQAIQQGEDIDYQGASGSVDIQPNGNVTAGFIVWEAYRKPDKTLDYRTIGRFAVDELLVQLK